MAKQILYIHQGKQIKSKVDYDDEYELPRKGDVIALDRVAFRVLTEPQETTGAAGAIPVFTIYVGSDSDLFQASQPGAGAPPSDF